MRAHRAGMNDVIAVPIVIYGLMPYLQRLRVRLLATRRVV
jgi:hypothetical protein